MITGNKTHHKPKSEAVMHHPHFLSDLLQGYFQPKTWRGRILLHDSISTERGFRFSTQSGAFVCSKQEHEYV